MNYHLRVSFAELLKQASTPAADAPVLTAKMLEGMEKALAAFSGKTDLLQHLQMALELFRRYSAEHPQVEITDILPNQLQDWLTQNPGSQPLLRRQNTLAGPLRTLINSAGTRSGWLRRPLLEWSQTLRAARLLRLTPETQEMLAYFESHSRQVTADKVHLQEGEGNIRTIRRYKLLKHRLAPYPTVNRMDRAVHLLKVLGKDCFSKVTTAELRDYLFGDETHYDLRLHAVNEVAPVFANLHLSGYLPSNPFAQLEFDSKPKHIRSDFIPPEKMELLQHAGLGLQGQPPRLARAIAFCNLAYDTALRMRELLHLRVEDIRDDLERDLMTVRVRSEYQKGQGKMERIMPLYFAPTRQALRYYLREIRPRFAPTNDALFIGRRGTGLSMSAAGKDIEAAAAVFDIRTYKGAPVTAHIFRHTFATLNIRGLGLDLTLDDIVDRLRHEDSELARKVYVTDNPYLQNQRIEARQERLRATQPFSLLNTLPPETVLAWLKKELGLSPRILGEVESAQARRAARPVPAIPLSVTAVSQALITETDAVHILREFGVTAEALRKTLGGMKQGIHAGGTWMYHESFIWSLKNDYILQEEAGRRLTYGRTSLWNHREELGLISLGKVCLVRREAVNLLAKARLPLSSS